jgi:hypothetical protein
VEEMTESIENIVRIHQRDTSHDLGDIGISSTRLTGQQGKGLASTFAEGS